MHTKGSNIGFSLKISLVLILLRKHYGRNECQEQINQVLLKNQTRMKNYLNKVYLKC